MDSIDISRGRSADRAQIGCEDKLRLESSMISSCFSSLWLGKSKISWMTRLAGENGWYFGVPFWLRV